MKVIKQALFIGAVLLISLNLLQAQTATLGNLDSSLTLVQPATPDSIVQITAEAQGLTAVPYNNLPRGGTYWEVLPSGIAAPFPCPPLDSTLPIYGITGNIFLVDATGGQVAVNPRRLGMQLQTQVTASAFNAALESLATSIVNLITMVQNPPAPQLASPMMRTSMMASSLSSSQAYGNQVYLANFTAGFAYDGSMTANFGIAGGTNFVPYDILMTTNLLTSMADWNWIGIGYTSNNYTFYSQPFGNAFYRLAKPSKTMVVGWGGDSEGQCDPPSGLTNAVAISAGEAHSVALKANGTMLAWGANDYGELDVPADLTNIMAVAAGYHVSLAVCSNGTVVAWGLDVYGVTDVPTGLSGVSAVVAGTLHGVALQTNGAVVAWGNDYYGQTDVPADLTNVTQIAACSYHSLALKSDGTVEGWGLNYSNEIIAPAGLSHVMAIDTGLQHSLALTADGTVTAWGDNSRGQCNVPAGLSNVVAVAAGFWHSAALKKDGTVAVWGNDEAVAPVGGLDQVIGISANGHQVLSLRTGPATPVITLEPVDDYQVPGSNATFTAKGAGLYGVSYQWQTNGVNVPGATTAALTLTNVQPPAQLASYSVVVGNEVGSIVSSDASLHFVTPPTIISQSPMPTNQAAIYQSNLVLSVVATAPGMTNGFPLSYQWQFNGTNLAGATSASYTIHATANSFGTYSVRVSNAAGGTNAAWQVTVYYSGGLAITQQPTNQYQVTGRTINFYGGGVSSNAVAYQWAFNGTNIVGATNTSLTLTNAQAAQQGYYNFTISSGGNNLTSSNAYFYLVMPPTITSQSLPTNITAIFQTNVTLSVAATALGSSNGFPIGYQWQFNGTNIGSAKTTSYAFNAGANSSGTYSVLVTNAAGSTNMAWQVTMTYAGSYIDVGTLAYYLSTNAVGRTNGFSSIYNAQIEVSGWTYDTYYDTNMAHLTNSVWSTNFWLKGVQGLSATPIGISNCLGGENLLTMISPRHYLRAYHTGTPSGMIAFLDTNNVIYWRTSVQQVDIGTNIDDIKAKDTSVGILDSDLPPSVGFLMVIPTNYANYLPTSSISYVQGIGMNQNPALFGQPMTLGNPNIVWNSSSTAPFGLTTNWNVTIRGGDSSNPEMFLIGNQFVLVSHNHTVPDGPNYALLFDAVNHQMHYLSTNNIVGTNDYQLTQFSLTNWPAIH